MGILQSLCVTAMMGSIGANRNASRTAIVHLMFNMVGVLMPLNGLLVKIAYLLIPSEETPQQVALLDERLLGTPAVAVQRTHEIAAKTVNDGAKAMELEDRTDRYEDALGTYLVKLSNMNLSVSDNRILNTMLYTVADIERTADHCSNIAVEMLQAAVEAHEYLNALKAGELSESAAFNKRFAKYKAQYAFPEEN